MDQAESEHWYTRFRQRVRSRAGVDLAYRIVVGVVGTAVLCMGIIAIPAPGPGWLIVFGGLAILGTEFYWAKRLLRFVRRRYDAWTRWLHRQPHGLRLVVMAATGAVVLLMLWLLGVFGLVAGVLRLPWDWVQSPIPWIS